MATVTTTDEFIDLLSHSNLLTDEQLDRVRRTINVGDEPKSIALRMVQKGDLTRWQAQQLLAGRSNFFLGQYKLLEGIGKGGMGVVFKAEQPSFKRLVALKVMSQSLLNSSAAAARFAREIQTVGSLNHPTIIAAHDAQCIDNTHFLVMEYAEGRNLKSWVRELGQMPIEWSCEVSHQIACGLQHAHEKGLVHRDIKPSNVVLVTESPSVPPQVKILDFGMARFMSETKTMTELTQTGEVMGSPDYIAPEQARSTKDADIRSDIYSLGCTLYELLTGKLPFTGQNVMEKLLVRVTNDAPRVSLTRTDVPPALDDVVARMTARHPHERFQTPAEVADALLPFTGGSASQSGTIPVMPQHPPVPQPSSIAAHADDTLTGFIHKLDNKTRDDTPLMRRSSSSIRLPSFNSVKKVDSKTLKTAVSVIGGLIAVIGLAMFFMSGEEPVEEERPQLAEEEFLDDGESYSSSSTSGKGADWDVAKLVLAIRGSVKLEIDGEVDDYLTLPEEPFTLIGVHLINNSQLSDDDLEGFGELKNLETLLLRGSAITDDGLMSIGQIESLKKLNLAETNVSDDGLAALSGLSNLEELVISRTLVSSNGIRNFQQSVPGCRIVKD